MNLCNLEIIFKNQPPYRLQQAYRAIFINLINSWAEVTNLPNDLRQELDRECPLDINGQVFQSKDERTIKAALSLADGEIIESVLMRHADGRNTVCVSTQIGCALGCDFCLTGKYKFKRNITAWEIVEQVLFFCRLLKIKNKKVTGVVFMGMGEPLLNYDEVIEAIYLLNDKDKLNIGARHLSISTVGITEGIKKLALEPKQINLALSLHAPTDVLRKKLMPVANKYPLKEILKAVAYYIEKTNRRVMIEYLLLKGVNDSLTMAKELTELLNYYLGKLYFINLITYNQAGGYKPSEKKQVQDFKRYLEKQGITVIQRYAFGKDIKGACGQLAGKLPKLLKKTKNGKI